MAEYGGKFGRQNGVKIILKERGRGQRRIQGEEEDSPTRHRQVRFA